MLAQDPRTKISKKVFQGRGEESQKIACVTFERNKAERSSIFLLKMSCRHLIPVGLYDILEVAQTNCTLTYRLPISSEPRTEEWAQPRPSEGAEDPGQRQKAAAAREDDSDTDLTYGEVEQRLDLLQQHLNRYELAISGCTPSDAQVDLLPPPRPLPWQELTGGEITLRSEALLPRSLTPDGVFTQHCCLPELLFRRVQQTTQVFIPLCSSKEERSILRT